MSIQILPARLANQIAAGEVVERPASVVKELVENSIDAGATQIRIEIEKGGAKRIRITDNGSGIGKDELTLALSRHATSKIKNLDDLESINSLGFRGEALASISSVSRLTLTSMPEGQEAAWQAIAVGRDMAVDVKPAAHPQGTTINVEDLFFNTPARRKFLRTEKTEFTHIDEVVKRIALSKLALNITLVHNGKIIRQYRSAKTDKQIEKRIAQVCGQNFIDHAIKLEFHHDSLHLWGWIASPEFSRMQNDLCYSYVNDRMMRDKLINHAIRQAYADRLVNDGYPAFVLFLNLDFGDVDVNVHPAKHEVRFHQSRFVHDFICAAVEQTLANTIALEPHSNPDSSGQSPNDEMHQPFTQEREYVQPLRVAEQHHSGQSFNQSSASGGQSRHGTGYGSGGISQRAVDNYQSLLTPIAHEQSTPAIISQEQTKELPKSRLSASTDGQYFNHQGMRLLSMVAPQVALMELKDELRCVNLASIALVAVQLQMAQAFSAGIISQPLLLPISFAVSTEQSQFLESFQSHFELAGIHYQLNKRNVVIRQYPAQLREMDVQQSFLDLLSTLEGKDVSHQDEWVAAFAQLKVPETITAVQASQLLINVINVKNNEIFDMLRLNSVLIDLNSYIKQLN